MHVSAFSGYASSVQLVYKRFEKVVAFEIDR